jgi:hypothetical protein
MDTAVLAWPVADISLVLGYVGPLQKLQSRIANADGSVASFRCKQVCRRYPPSVLPPSLLEFVERWKATAMSEHAAAQSHFIDLCEVLASLPAADYSGESFTFQKRVSTLEDGKGFADVWKREFFGWEYKGKDRNLSAAYAQLVRY